MTLLPDWVRVGVVSPYGGDDAPRLLPFSDIDLVVALGQHGALVDVVNKDGDCCRGCGAVATAHQPHGILGTHHQDVLALPLKIQNLQPDNRCP